MMNFNIFTSMCSIFFVFWLQFDSLLYLLFIVLFSSLNYINYVGGNKNQNATTSMLGKSDSQLSSIVLLMGILLIRNHFVSVPIINKGLPNRKKNISFLDWFLCVTYESKLFVVSMPKSVSLKVSF